MTLATLFRRPLFWAIFALLALSCAALAARFASRALPVVSVDIRMDRAGALQAAEELHKQNGWKPAKPRLAAAFLVDFAVQDFVELGAGGIDEFRKMVAGDLYEPYSWQVRIYQEGVESEVRVSFTPEGAPYGFIETVPESGPGAALDSGTARQIAERSAAAWRVNLESFDFIQASEETRTSGRVDHSFVYERRGVRIGEEGKYRVRLSVAGDKLSEVRHFVKIPQSFSRSYERLRSANNTLGTTAYYAAAVLFGVGGLGFGLLFLLRKRLVVWKKPLLWGAIVAAGLSLTQLSDIPLAEMGYDTAISRQAFIFNEVAFAIGDFFGSTVFLALVFMGAEGLTRVAFPRHLQLWRLWSRGVSGSRQVIGRTVAGYLVLGIDLALLVGFYLLARTRLGWYVPSSFPVDPNVLASYAPWLPPIAISMYAAFFEESLFRAVPIASAVLLGRRFGRTGMWVLGAFAVQAILFGAAHAGYGAQPAYARLVELIVPALFFGLLYYFFGLLPAVLLHFAVDVAFISIPLFATTADGIWLHRGLVIVIALVPLWIAIAGAIKVRGMRDAPASELNAEWTRQELPGESPRRDLPLRPMTSPLAWSVIALGVAGVAALIWIDVPRPEVPGLRIDRAAAADIATRAVREQGFDPRGWNRLVTVGGSPGDGDIFIWRSDGEETYERLLGTYLAPPHYRVRFARFTGSLADRAEERLVYVSGSGEVFRASHSLPEDAVGEKLSLDLARMLARDALAKNFGISADTLREVSAAQDAKPNRLDWTFVFRDPSVALRQGEARIRISISGGIVSDFERYIHVPSEGVRIGRAQTSILGTIRVLCLGGVLLGFAIAAGISVFSMARKRFDLPVFIRTLALMLALSFGSVLNSFPSLKASLSTAQPAWSQLFTSMGRAVVEILVISAGIAVMAGHLTRSARKAGAPTGLHTTSSAALGAAIRGAVAVSATIFFSNVPIWPSFGPADDLIPLLNFGGIRFFVIAAATVMMICDVVHTSTLGWTQRKMLALFGFIFAGLFLSGPLGIDSVGDWLAKAAVLSAGLMGVYFFLYTRNPTLVPLAVAVYVSLASVREALFDAFPGSDATRSIQVIAILGLAIAWGSVLRTPFRERVDEE